MKLSVRITSQIPKTESWNRCNTFHVASFFLEPKLLQ
ncbi:unnamed protein product [Brassica oleracea]